MKIAIGCDHGGFELKENLTKKLKDLGYEIFDFGTYSLDSVDYPDFAVEVSKNVAAKLSDFGVLICTTGEGICMAANKVKGIRCGIGYNDEVSEMIRRHNDANIIAFGAKYTTLDEAVKRVQIFTKTAFEGGRHLRRVDKINCIK